MKLLIYHARQCDPKRCTAMKLKRFSLVDIFYTPMKIPRDSIVLSPFGEKALSKQDESYIGRGIVALDCSWEHADEVFNNLKVRVQRRTLPLLMASNPVNYGNIGKLSTAEALSASLYILGYKERAEEILSKFKWGHTFFELNREALEDYSSAKDSKDILMIQKEYF